MFRCFVQNQLKAINLARKTRNNQSRVRISIHNFADTFADSIFAVWVCPRRIDVGAFVHQKINTFFLRNFSQARHIKLHINRVVFETPVAHMNDISVWRSNNHRHTTWNRVKNMNKFERHMFRNSNFFVLERIDNLIVWRNFNNCFFHLALNHSNREICRVNWNIIAKFWQKLSHRTDVVEVGVRKSHRLNFMHIILQVSDVGRHKIHTRIIFVREYRAHIDHENFIFIFNGEHVFTDSEFTQTTKRNNLHAVSCWSKLFENCRRELFAIKTVEKRFVDRNINDVLTGTKIDVVTNHSLSSNNRTAASCCWQIDFFRICFLRILSFSFALKFGSFCGFLRFLGFFLLAICNVFFAIFRQILRFFL